MNKTREDLYLIVYMVLMSVMLFARDIAGIGLNKYMFFVVASFFMAIVPIDSLIYMLVFTFPLFCGLPSAHIRLAAIVLYLVKKRRVALGQLFFSVFVILWEFIAANWYPSISMEDILGYLSAPVMLFLFLWNRDENVEIDYKKCLSLFMVGFLMVCIIVLGTAILKSPYNWMTSFAQGLLRRSLTYTDKNVEGVLTKMNANTLAYFCCVCVAISICLIRNDSTKGEKSPLINYMFTAFFTIVGVLTLSRTFFLIIAIVFALNVISSMKTIRSTIFALAGSVILIGGGCRAISLMPTLSDSIFGRFSSISTLTAGGRTDLIAAYMNVFLSSERFKWLGTGVVEYRTMTGLWNSIHNGTQQILVCMGIPGFILFMIGLILPIKREIERFKPAFFYAIPLISVVLFVQSIQFLNPTILIFPYILGYFSLKVSYGKSIDASER